MYFFISILASMIVSFFLPILKICFKNQFNNIGERNNGYDTEKKNLCLNSGEKMKNNSLVTLFA